MNSSKRTFQPRLETLEERLTPADTPSLVPPVLNSLPGAAASLYLDFNGHFDAVWNSIGGNFNNVDTPPFSLDSNINQWSTAEIQFIRDVWQSVAEDFAPFKINVTTVLPSSIAPRVAMRVAIGGNGAWYSNPSNGILGVASGFTAFANGATSLTCYSFSANTLSFGVTSFFAHAMVISHEAGHMLGLRHQSTYNASGGLVTPYSQGLPDGTAPTMGNNFFTTRNLWWYGRNDISFTTFQDDMQVLAGTANGFGFRSDDYGNNAATAKALKGTGLSTTNVSAKGIIEQMTDVDWFRFSAKPGAATFTVDVADGYNNLDPIIELRSKTGQVLASANPTTSFDASVTFNIPSAGTYYVVVASAGQSSASTPQNYGMNVGQYTLNGTYVPLNDPIKIYSPTRYSFDPKTKIYTGVVTIQPLSFGISGPITIQITLPSASIRWVSPNGTQVGRVVTFTVNQDIVAGVPFRFTIKLRNPGNVPLGTFYNGLIVSAG